MLTAYAKVLQWGRGIDMGLIEIRKEYHLSQSDAAAIAGIPLRTYVRYENDEQYGDNLKREMMIQKINQECEMTETKGLLTIDKIKEIVSQVIAREYEGRVHSCFLFGSYAKGYATEKSDVDLAIYTDVTGFRYYGLIEDFRQALHKKVDLVCLNTIGDNVELLQEILKDGIKIYEQPQK